MSILPETQVIENAITLYPATTTGAAWLANVSSRAIQGGDPALELPVGELVQMFLNAAGGDSTNTARAYLSGVALFLQFLTDELGGELPEEWRPLARPTQEGRKTVWEFRGLAGVLRRVVPGTLDNFTAWRQLEGDSRATSNLRRRAVCTFLRVAYREGVLTDGQAQKMGLRIYRKREKRDEKPVGRRLTGEEVRKLREIVLLKAKSEPKAIRDRAILDLSLFVGLRRDEIANLTVGNIRPDGGRWWLVLTGKGQKVRRIKVHDVLYKSLADLCSLAGLSMGEGEYPLFTNLAKGGKTTGNRLNGSVIGRLVAEYGFYANLAPLAGENCLSPHDLRRTCARNAFDNGATLPQVQAMLGHSDVKTTMHYIGSVEDDTNTAVDFVRY
jgi:integrase